MGMLRSLIGKVAFGIQLHFLGSLVEDYEDSEIV